MSSGHSSDNEEEIITSVLDRWNPKWDAKKPIKTTKEVVKISTAGDDGEQGIKSLVSRWKNLAEKKKEEEPDRSKLQVVKRKKIDIADGEENIDQAEIKTIFTRQRYKREDIDREIQEAKEQLEKEAEIRRKESEEDDKRREALRKKRELEEQKRKEEEEERKRLLKEAEIKRREEDKKRREAAQKRRQALMHESEINSELNPKRNFEIKKKSNDNEIDDQDNNLMLDKDAGKSEEELESEKRKVLDQRIPSLDIEDMTYEELLETAQDLWYTLVSTASATYDLTERSKRKEYEIKDLKERRNAMKNKPLSSGAADFPLMAKTERSISALAEKFTNAPPKVDIMNPYSRVADKRSFADKLMMFQK